MNKEAVAKELLAIASELQAADKSAAVFPSQNALRDYLREHPDSDRANHKVNYKEWKRKYRSSERSITAAVAKIPIFSKFDREPRPEEIERQFIKYYPDAIAGSLRCDGVQGRAEGNRGEMFSNILMDTQSGEVLTGSVIIALETAKNGYHRIYAYLRIDG